MKCKKCMYVSVTCHCLFFHLQFTCVWPQCYSKIFLYTSYFREQTILSFYILKSTTCFTQLLFTFVAVSLRGKTITPTVSLYTIFIWPTLWKKIWSVACFKIAISGIYFSRPGDRRPYNLDSTACSGFNPNHNIL